MDGRGCRRVDAELAALGEEFELLKRRLRQLGYKDSVDSYSSETIEALLGDLMRVSKAYQASRRDPAAAYDFEETDAPGEERFKFKNLSRENEELNGRLLALRQDLLHRDAELQRYKALAEGCAEEARKARNLLEAENAHLRAENAELRRRLAQAVQGGGSRGAEAFRDLLARLAPAEEPPTPHASDALPELTRQLRQSRAEGAEKTQLLGLYSQEIERLRAKVAYFEKLQRSLIAAEAVALDQRQQLQAQVAQEAHVDARRRAAPPLEQLLRQIDDDVLKIKSSLMHAQPAEPPRPAEPPAAAKTHQGGFYRAQGRVEAETPAAERALRGENAKLLELVYKLCADKDRVIETLLGQAGGQPVRVESARPARVEPARPAPPGSATTIAEAAPDAGKGALPTAPTGRADSA